MRVTGKLKCPKHIFILLYCQKLRFLCVCLKTLTIFLDFPFQKLGPIACSVVPFLQTLVVLVNSILLVCIALDRYMACVRIVKGSWEPSKVFCVTCCVLIWGFSAGVSSPMLTLYDHVRIYVVPLPDPNDDNPKLTYYSGYLCGSDKVHLPIKDS